MLLAAALVSTSCGGGSGPPTGDIDVDELIEQAASAMGALESARFTMERGGAPVEIAGLEFASAEGQYAAPDAARALLTVRIDDLTVELGTIAIGEQVWLTNPLTGAWEEIEPGTGFNIAVIFDPALGWVPLLTEDLADVEYLGRRDTPEGPREAIAGVISATRVEFLTAGLVAAQSVDAEIWIDPVAGHITRVEFETDLDGAVSRWVIEMREFDAPVAITPPAGS